MFKTSTPTCLPACPLQQTTCMCACKGDLSVCTYQQEVTRIKTHCIGITSSEYDTPMQLRTAERWHWTFDKPLSLKPDLLHILSLAHQGWANPAQLHQAIQPKLLLVQQLLHTAVEAQGEDRPRFNQSTAWERSALTVATKANLVSMPMGQKILQ